MIVPLRVSLLLAQLLLLATWIVAQEPVLSEPAFEGEIISSEVQPPLEEFDEAEMMEIPPEFPLVRPRPKIDLNSRSPFRLGMTWLPSESIENAPETLSLQTIGVDLAFPLRIEAEGIWLATSRVEQTTLRSNAVLPVSGIPLPEHLWDIRFGTMRFKTLANGWKVGGFFNFGSAGDRPFGDSRDLTVSTLAYASIPYGPRDAWNFTLFYSPTGQIPFPIPGIAYVWRPSPALEAEIGLPASLTYRPNDSFSLQARYTPVTDFQVEARQWLDETWSLYGRFEIASDTFWLSDRENRFERFFRFEQRLRAGITRELPWGLRADAGVAYVFDRKFLLSEDFDLGAPDLLAIEPGMAYLLQISWNR